MRIALWPGGRLRRTGRLPPAHEDPTLDVDEHSILVVRGAGPVGIIPGSAESG